MPPRTTPRDGIGQKDIKILVKILVMSFLEDECSYLGMYINEAGYQCQYSIKEQGKKQFDDIQLLFIIYCMKLHCF